MGTKLVMPDITFEKRHVIELGGVRIEALNLGPAHSPGDIMVWLPQRKIAITGDRVSSKASARVRTYGHRELDKNVGEICGARPEVIISRATGQPETRSLRLRATPLGISNICEAIGAIIEDGGILQDAYGVDQSDYAHLDTYDELSRINTGRIFRAMEFE